VIAGEGPHQTEAEHGDAEVIMNSTTNGDGAQELGLVRVPADTQLVPIDLIKPSPENDKLYKPVDPGDPEIRDLAASIREKGLLEPLVITLDDYLLSGHRRYTACKLARLQEVCCRREAIFREGDPDEFIRLLREYNRQRVKSLDEVIREEVVSASPEEAYRLLLEHRKAVAHVEADVIELKEGKRQYRITEAKTPFLEAVRVVLRERRDFWPLTLRQVHYALLNAPPLKHAGKADSRYLNDQSSYKSLSELLTRARLSGVIPVAAIDDETRPVVTWNCHKSPTSFVRRQLDGFLKGFYRDLQQSQPNHIEIVGEKNTIDNIVRPVAMKYRLPLTIGRGYSSLPPRYKMLQRFRASGKERLVILVLSDFDPEGEDIAHSFARSMRDDLGVKNIVPIKVALTADQVEEMRLPPFTKAKKKSSRRKGFVAAYGETVHELEAVPPARLQEILREAIGGVLDADAFEAEVDAEKQDAANLEAHRRAFRKLLEDELEEK
jgi:hypothetical protein